MHQKPRIIGHRGASAHAPENTLAAFQIAIDAGADGVEFDVQLAKDGVPVVIHDATLKRTGGRNDAVADLTSKELGKIDVGSWFNKKYPKWANADFAKETVPTLAQVLRLLKSSDGLIYIELKATDADYRDLAKSVCDVIRDSPLLPRIIVKSFKLAAIPRSAIICRRCRPPLFLLRKYWITFAAANISSRWPANLAPIRSHSTIRSLQKNSPLWQLRPQCPSPSGPLTTRNG
ncbi:MAG: hypothetical protein IPK98_02910 [Chloracidobacterium sp.]|nr:hypothetical protein [Chloracidobacterium sp.]